MLKRWFLILLAPAAAVAAAKPAAVSFQTDLVPVLRSRCATCHMTAADVGFIALAPAAAYNNLVGVPSVQSKLVRVVPGKPDKSYLILKLENRHQAEGTGVRMPFGTPPLDTATLAMFRRWVAQGAKNN